MSPSTGWLRTFPGSSARRRSAEPKSTTCTKISAASGRSSSTPESGSPATGGTGPSSCLPATSPRTSAAETTNASAPNWPTTPSAEGDSNTLTPAHPGLLHLKSTHRYIGPHKATIWSFGDLPRRRPHRQLVDLVRPSLTREPTSFHYYALATRSG